jgi:hypothetical protein
MNSRRFDKGTMSDKNCDKKYNQGSMTNKNLDNGSMNDRNYDQQEL